MVFHLFDWFDFFFTVLVDGEWLFEKVTWPSVFTSFSVVQFVLLRMMTNTVPLPNLRTMLCSREGTILGYVCDQ